MEVGGVGEGIVERRGDMKGTRERVLWEEGRCIVSLTLGV